MSEPLLNEKELLLALQQIPAGNLNAKQIAAKLKRQKSDHPQLLEKILSHPSMIHQVWNAYLDREAILEQDEKVKEHSWLPMTAQLTLEYFCSSGGFSVSSLSSWLKITEQKFAENLRDSGERFSQSLQDLQITAFIAVLGGAQIFIKITQQNENSIGFRFYFQDKSALQRFQQVNGYFILQINNKTIEKQSVGEEITFQLSRSALERGGMLTFKFVYQDDLREIETVKILNVDLSTK